MGHAGELILRRQYRLIPPVPQHQLSLFHPAFRPEALRDILEPPLAFQQRRHGLGLQIPVAAQHRHGQHGLGVGHQAGQPGHIIRPQTVVGPPQAAGAHIRGTLRAALPLKAVIEGMGNEQVDAPHGQPVDEPLHIRPGEIPGIAGPAAGAEALVAVAGAAHQPGHIRAALAHHAVHALGAAGLRGHPAVHQILARHMEIPLHLNIIALVGVAHQGDAVVPAPAGQAAVIHLAFPFQDQPPVQGGIGVLLAGEQPFQARQAAAPLGKEPVKIPRPGLSLPGVAAQDAGLVGKKADDRFAKVFLQFPIIGFVGQGDEPPHRLRVQDIGAGRGVLFAVVLAVMHAPQGAPAEPLHQHAGGHPAQHPVLRGRGFHPGDLPAGQLRMPGHHLAAGRAGGIHALVIEHHPHLQLRRRLHGGADIPEKQGRQIADAPGQAHAGMQHHPIHPMIPEIPQLAADLPVGKIAVQEPEWHGGVFPGRMIQQLQQIHSVLLYSVCSISRVMSRQRRRATVASGPRVHRRKTARCTSYSG